MKLVFSHGSFWLVTWIMIVLVVIVVYLPGLPGYWVFDDFGSIASNPALALQLHHPGLWQFIALLTQGSGMVHRPISMLSFYLDALWFGMEPATFKLTNIFIHVLAGICLWLMAHQLLCLYARNEPRLNPTAILTLSTTATALWLIHPLNLTAVLYVVQRETALSALFTALAIWIYLLGREKQFDGGTGTWQIWFGTPLLTLFGMLCKENAALVPVYLLVIEFTVLRFSDKTRHWNPHVVAFFGTFLLIPASLVAGLLITNEHILLGGYSIRDFTLSERLLTECRVIFDYLRWAFLPDLSELSLYHDDMIISHDLLNPLITLMAVIGLSALLCFAVFARTRLRWLSFAVLWFLGGHVMESTFIPLELVFEHRNYLPIFGLIFGIATEIYIWLHALNKQKLGIIIAILVGVVFATLTALRAAGWSSPINFAVSEVVHHPRSVRAHYELGIIYVAMAMSNMPQMDSQAQQTMVEARAMDSDGLAEDVALSIMYTKLGNLAAAHVYFADAAERARRNNFSVTTQVALTSLLKQPNLVDKYPPQVVRSIFNNLLKNPRMPLNPCYVADIWNIYGLFLLQSGDLAPSIEALRAGLGLCPSNTQIRFNYTDALLAQNNLVGAQQQIELIKAANRFGKYTFQLKQIEQNLSERLTK